jgi:hypothetical protein
MSSMIRAMAGFANELLLAKAFVKLLNPKRLPIKKRRYYIKTFFYPFSCLFQANGVNGKKTSVD